ncbi:MAG: hypothetical protein E6J54_30570 [Deltaproteobacteria bacterium]|nr:MAG: hypothetical protein E6J54_30570 [Deltaproteobacteria bacterium]
MKDKEKEIEELRKKLETVKQTTVGSENISLNDVHRRILNELLGARVQLKALNEKKAALTNQVESYSTAAADKKRKKRTLIITRRRPKKREFPMPWTSASSATPIYWRRRVFPCREQVGALCCF